MLQNFVVASLIILVPAVAYVKKALSISASFLAALMIFVASTASLNHAIFLVIAFLLISGLDKVCKKRTVEADRNITQKVGTRDFIQVFVNGGVSMICVLLWHLTHNRTFLLCFASALVESLGDSSASDIGIASNQQAFDICRFRSIPIGLSGGITIAGTLGCFAACLILSCVAYALRIANTRYETVILVLSSFLGCIIDSVLGSLIQRKNKCAVCGRITEKSIHCNKSTLFYSGCKKINNDVVNLMCNAFSASCVLLISRLL